MEILLSENDGFSFNFHASILGGGQLLNRGFSQQCSPVLPFLGFFRAISSQVPCVVTIEASAKCPEHQQKSTFLIPSYSILFHLTTSFSSYFGGKKGISRNKTSFFLLMRACRCSSVSGFL